jgi:CRISPR-associated endonuclease Cas1
MLDRTGSVLAVTGPVRPSDARLRRAQAIAAVTGTNITIARYLIEHKLAGQERVAREKLRDTVAADAIGGFRKSVVDLETLDAIRHAESQGAALYWGAWSDLPITFPTKDLPLVPEHWRVFAARRSPLTGSPRVAVNPANAMLNYLYAVLESESRLALAALGLDPGLGFVHMDAPARDSLACDLMESVRPVVDGYVLDWICSRPLKREWFFEERNGNCRLMASLTEKLSETATTWGRAVAPFAEWIARTLWKRSSKPAHQILPPTRLTQQRKREAKGGEALPVVNAKPKLESICSNCGNQVKPGSKTCIECSREPSRQRMIATARKGRENCQTQAAKDRRSATQRRQATARYSWEPSSQPIWLTREFYLERVQPLLQNLTISGIAGALGVSKPYAARVRSAQRIPHPRHWLALANRAG